MFFDVSPSGGIKGCRQRYVILLLTEREKAAPGKPSCSSTHKPCLSKGLGQHEIPENVPSWGLCISTIYLKYPPTGMATF